MSPEERKSRKYVSNRVWIQARKQKRQIDEGNKSGSSTHDIGHTIRSRRNRRTKHLNSFLSEV